jgi:hypothetical protein
LRHTCGVYIESGLNRGRAEGKVLVIEAGIDAYWRRIHKVRLEQRQASRQRVWLTGTGTLRQAVRQRGRQQRIWFRGRQYARLSGKEAGSKEFGLEAGITAGCQAKRQTVIEEACIEAGRHCN